MILRKRGIVFIVTTALAAIVLFSVYHAKIDQASFRDERLAVPEYQDASKPVLISAGQAFVIALAGDRGGFRWQLESSWDNSLLQIIEINHQAAKTKQGERQVKDLWTFKGLRQGETEVLFTAASPAARGTPPEQKVFTVKINDGPAKQM